MVQSNDMFPLQECSSLNRIDLVSFVFGNTGYDQNRKIYIDPDRPARSLSANEARCLVRQLVSGFKANGLQYGDCVCVHAFNDVGARIYFEHFDNWLTVVDYVHDAAPWHHRCRWALYRIQSSVHLIRTQSPHAYYGGSIPDLGAGTTASNRTCH